MATKLTDAQRKVLEAISKPGHCLLFDWWADGSIDNPRIADWSDLDNPVEMPIALTYEEGKGLDTSGLIVFCNANDFTNSAWFEITEAGRAALGGGGDNGTTA